MAATRPQAPSSPPPTLQAAFAQCSARAAGEAPELRIQPPRHRFREDIPKCLEMAAGAPLGLPHLAALHRSFPLDTSPLISWEEFQACFQKFSQAQTATGQAVTRSRARLIAARRKGLEVSGCVGGGGAAAAAVVPPTSSREIGWYAPAAAALAPASGAATYAALKGTDVTKGKEGRTMESYYGAHLGRLF